MVRVDRARKRNPLVQSSSGKKAGGWEVASGGSEEEEERATLLTGLAYESSKGATAGPGDQGATATNEMDTDLAADAQAQFERTQEILKARAEGKEGDNVYRGLSTYGAKVHPHTPYDSSSPHTSPALRSR